MNFVDVILKFFSNALEKIVDFFYSIFLFIKPLIDLLLEFFYGIGYLIYMLALVVWSIIKLFVALIQFFGAIVIGFFRTLFSFLNPQFNTNQVNLETNASSGLQYVFGYLFETGFMTVVPYIVLALFWFLFAKKVIALFGGRDDNS